MHSRTNKPSGRAKRSLQENQAKSRVGCAHGNRVSSCFALRCSFRRSSYIPLVFALATSSHFNAFKDLPKSTVVTQLYVPFLFYDHGYFLSHSINEDLVDR